MTIHNAFRTSVALSVMRALRGVPAGAWRRDDRWQGGAYAGSGFFIRRWVLDNLEAAPHAAAAAGGSTRGAAPGGSDEAAGASKGAKLLRRLRRFLDGLAARALLTRLGGVKLSGNSTVTATLFRHGDHLGPHSDVATDEAAEDSARRRLGFTWHLSPQWAAERGGELVFFCPFEQVGIVFNSLTIFSVGGGSTHMVLPVVEDQHAPLTAEAAAEAEEEEDDETLEPWAEAPDAAASHRLSISGWFKTTDHARAVGVESMVVSMQPCDATPPLFNT